MSVPEQYLEQFAQTCGMDASAAIRWALAELTQLRARIAELEELTKFKAPRVTDEYPAIIAGVTIDSDENIREALLACRRACKVYRGVMDKYDAKNATLTAQVEALTAERDQLRKAAVAFQKLNACYRVGGKPSEKLFTDLEKARATLEATAVHRGGPIGGGPER